VQSLSGIEILEHSNKELKRLNEELNLLKMDEEDVRYDVFNSIYNMLHDNIQLRMKNNKLSKRILS
jgi:regulator of replication initiation timing|tara:strand:+ start:423 stop:620 length:198 start_codon:yes stop_codon:yes gene_type:complete